MPDHSNLPFQSISVELTDTDETFFGLLKIAAQWDCLYVVEFHCMKLYGHDRVTSLSQTQQMQLYEYARRDIFKDALLKGYKPAQGRQLQ